MIESPQLWTNPRDRRPMTVDQGRAYVLVVNYRRWRDTIECLESVLRGTGVDCRVLVCDNGSGNGSWERLLEWAEGRLEAAPADPAMARFCLPNLRKPLRYRALDEDEAVVTDPAPVPVTFIRSRENRGFAGGNNLCLQHALRDGEARWIWILNNDAVVAPDALARLVERLQASPGAGMCGSTVAFYHRPGTVQAMGGGRYNSWLGAVRHVGEGEAVGTEPRESPSYVLGASLLASAAFVREVGPLCEDYFLYFEELDWAARSAGRYAIVWAPESVVYHKEGASSGSTRTGASVRPAFADYCGIRSRLLFTRRFYPWALPTVCLGLLVALANRARRGQWARIPGMLALLLTIGGGRQRLPAWMEQQR